MFGLTPIISVLESHRVGARDPIANQTGAAGEIMPVELRGLQSAPSFCMLPSLLPKESEFLLRNAIREEEQEAFLGCLD
jgi:hypothetical protein